MLSSKIIASMLLLIPLTSFSQENGQETSLDNSQQVVNKVSSAMTEMLLLKLQQLRQGKSAGGIDQAAANDAVASALSKEFFIFKPVDENNIKTSAQKLKELNDDADALAKGYTIIQPDDVGSSYISYKVTSSSRICFIHLSTDLLSPLNSRIVTVDSMDCSKP
ncbi:TPA: hypothetical protein ACIBH9_003662 [Salmonella enterica subsp. diarizonae serovar 61:l,v:z35]